MHDILHNGSVKLDGDDVLIRIPRSEVQGLCVALAECPCKAAKSTITAGIRGSIRRALAKVTSTRSVRT